MKTNSYLHDVNVNRIDESFVYLGTGVNKMKSRSLRKGKEAVRKKRIDNEKGNETTMKKRLGLNNEKRMKKEIKGEWKDNLEIWMKKSEYGEV